MLSGGGRRMSDEHGGLIDASGERLDISAKAFDVNRSEGETTNVDGSEGTSLAAARLWLYLVRRGHARIAWSCTSMTYRLMTLRELLPEENPIAVEQRALRGPGDHEWESFGPPWHEAMASLVEAWGEDWAADSRAGEEPDRVVVEFTPPGRTEGQAAPRPSVVFTMLHTAGRWLVDDITWRDRSEDEES